MYLTFAAVISFPSCCACASKSIDFVSTSAAVLAWIGWAVIVIWRKTIDQLLEEFKCKGMNNNSLTFKRNCYNVNEHSLTCLASISFPSGCACAFKPSYLVRTLSTVKTRVGSTIVGIYGDIIIRVMFQIFCFGLPVAPVFWLPRRSLCHHRNPVIIETKITYVIEYCSMLAVWIMEIWLITNLWHREPMKHFLMLMRKLDLFPTSIS